MDWCSCEDHAAAYELIGAIGWLATQTKYEMSAEDRIRKIRQELAEWKPAPGSVRSL